MMAGEQRQQPREERAIVMEYTTGLPTAKFADCMKGDSHQQEINDNTQKALSLGVNGLPYMVINDYQTSGFAGGENGLKAILKAGGVN